VGLDALRSKLAQQRARGEENQVTEEEEEMLLSSFRFRSKQSNTPPQDSSDKLLTVSEDGSVRQSIQSTTTVDSSQSSAYPSSLTSTTPSRKSSKRYSNHLFGSGRLRDYTYTKSKNGSSKSQSIQSLTPSESSNQVTTSSLADSLRAVTPENARSPSPQPSPNPSEQDSSVHSSQHSENGEHVVSMAEYRISKSMGPAALKRASLALQQAIQEIEEADDEILLPRSTPIPRTSIDQGAGIQEARSLSSHVKRLLILFTA
jgi:serine/arginine repetitive matrix protein 2